MLRLATLTTAALLLGAAPAVTAAEAPAAKDKTRVRELTIGEAAKVNGVKLKLSAGPHRHKRGGGTSSRWFFDLTRKGKTRTITYIFNDDSMRWYIEGVEHGLLFTLSILSPAARQQPVAVPVGEKVVLDQQQTVIAHDRALVPRVSLSHHGLP